MHRVRYMERGAKLPCPLWGTFLSASLHVHQPRSYPNPVLLVFMETSLDRHILLNYWPLAVELNFQSLSPPWGLRVGAESFNLLITRLVPLAASPHPQITQGLSKNQLINISSCVVKMSLLYRNRRHTFHCYYFEAVSGTEDKGPSIIAKDASMALVQEVTNILVAL